MGQMQYAPPAIDVANVLAAYILPRLRQESALGRVAAVDWPACRACRDTEHGRTETGWYRRPVHAEAFDLR
jgi:hypothetical protein